MLLWRRKSKQFTARVNTVVETAEQTRQSFRPKQPRVAIDMSYVQGEPAIDADADPAMVASGPADVPATAHSTDAAAWATFPSIDPAEPSTPDGDATQPPAEDLPSYEDALTELAALRELADVFEGEFDREVAARTAVEAERDEARRLAAEATRTAEDAHASLRVRSESPAQTVPPDSPELLVRIEQLETQIQREQEGRAAVQAALESAQQQAREARADAEFHRNAALKAAIVAAPVAGPVAGPAAGSLQEQLENLKADFQAELIAEQSVRRATEAQRDLAERRIAAANREVEALRAAASKAASIHGLEAELAASKAASANLARELDDAKNRIVSLELDQGAREKVASEALAAARKDADTHRDSAQAAQAGLAAEREARAMLAGKLDEAAHRIGELQNALASRENATGLALAAVQNEAAAQRDLVLHIEAELAAEKAALAAAQGKLEDAAKSIAELQRASDASISRDNALAEIRQEADALRLRTAELEEALADAKMARGENEAELARTTYLVAELQSTQVQQRQEFDRLEARAQAAEAANQNAKLSTEAQQRIAELEGELALHASATEGALTAARLELESIRSALDKEQAEAAAAQIKAAAAEQRLIELQSASASRQVRSGLALSAVQNEAEAQRALVEQVEADLAVEQAARAAGETQLAEAGQMIAELRRLSSGNDTNAQARLEADALRSRTAYLEEALAEATTLRGGVEAELAQATYRLNEMQSKLALQSEAIDRLEARNLTYELVDDAQADDSQAEAEASAATKTRIADLEREIEAQRLVHSRAIDAALQDAEAQRALTVQLAAELKGEKTAFDGVNAQLGEVKRHSAEMQREHDRRASTIDPMSALRDSVGAIPPKAIAQPAAPKLVQPPSKVPPTARIDTLYEPVTVASTALTTEAERPVLARAQAFFKPNTKSISDGDSPEGRRERRMAAQSPATIWREGMSQAVSCTIKNRSSGGALLEFPANRHVEDVSEFSVGDEVTLTFTSYRERSSVTCVVARIEGRTCGVKFAGQFHVQLLKPHKPKKIMGKPELAKTGR